MATNTTSSPMRTIGEKVTDKQVLREHPVEVALFNSTRWITFVWLVVRLWLGFKWAESGWQKINNPKWMDGSKIADFWKGSLADYSKTNSDVAFEWYAGFLKGLQDSHSQTWFAPLIAWSELLGGIALMLGLFTGLVALLLAFMNFNYMLAGSAGVNPVYLLLAILVVLAWKNAGWWGLDRFVLPALGSTGSPGSLFKAACSSGALRWYNLATPLLRAEVARVFSSGKVGSASLAYASGRQRGKWV